MDNTNKPGIIVLPEKIANVAVRLNNSVMSVIGKESVIGFEKAYMVSSAITELKSLLTPEYMKPIMELQGNKLGFKTDKIYDESVVKNCLIEAVLFGLQPCGNQFNIISGNMYATKEGCGYLLSKIPGLKYDIVAELPRINGQSSAVVMVITWSINGAAQETKKIDIPIRVNERMGTDAIIGKATRKARKWLYDTITGSEIPEGDVSDVDRGNCRTIDITAQQVSLEDLQLLFDMKRERLTPDEEIDCERIIKNKEEKSYAKMQKLLSEK